MNQCPYCQETIQQVKAGLNDSGSQRWRCKACRRYYTPERKLHGYPEGIRQQAVQMAVDGVNFRRIARQLGVNHQSVINWVNAHAAKLPANAPVPERVTTVELDEVFTWVGKKKTKSSS